jgi:hypothetical protein
MSQRNLLLFYTEGGSRKFFHDIGAYLPYCIASLQKTVIFIFFSVRTSNLTMLNITITRKSLL